MPIARRYLLEVDGLGVFQVSAASLGASRGSSVVQYQDLSLVFADDAGLAELLAKVASGSQIANARLVGFGDNGAGGEIVVSSVSLRDVVVSSLNDVTGGGFNATLRFAAVTMNTWAPDGTPAFAGGYTHDLGTATTTASAPVTSTPIAVPRVAVAPTTYYVLIDGLNGGSTHPGHVGWFEVSGLNWLVSRPTGSGAADFGSVSMAMDDPAGLGSILYNVAAGRTLRGVQIDGVDAVGRSVYQLGLAGVRIDSASTDQSGEQQVSLRFDRIRLVTDADGPGGAAADPVFAWNLVTRTVDATAMPTLAPGPARPADPDIDRYVLKVDGFGEFEVEAFNWGGAQPGSSAGSALFSNVQLTLADEAGLTQFLAALSSGAALSKANVLGLIPSPTTGAPVVAYNLGLTNVAVTSVAETAGGGYTVSLAYARISLNTYAYNAGGAAISTGGFELDVQRAIASNGGSGSSLVALAGTAAPIAAEKYYLLIDGLNGGSTDPGHVGWFELPVFSLGALRATSAAFGDLNVVLPASIPIGALFYDLAADRPIAGLRIEGVRADGQTVYELNLAQVTVTSVQQAGTDAPGAERAHFVSFDYGGISLITNATRSDGSLGPDQTYAWNLATGSTSVTLPTLNIGPAREAAVEPDAYVLAISGVGQFQVTSFSIGTGAAAAFSDLTVALADEAGLTAFLAAVASGRPWRDGHLVGLAPVGPDGQPAVTSDLSLSNILVTSVVEDADGGFRVSLDYDRVALTMWAYRDGVVYRSVDGFSYDVVRDIASPGGEASVPTVAPGTASALVEPEKYFLLIDGLNGGSTDPDHIGWFELPSFALGVRRAGSSHIPGTPVPSASFDSLNLGFADDTGLAALLQAVSADTAIRGAVIQGVRADGEAVYTLGLTGVRIGGVNETSRAGYSVDLLYTTIGLVTRATDPGGGLGAATSFGWNVPTNSSAGASVSGLAPFLPPAGEGADVLAGDNGANTLRGLGGSDRLVGNGGDDRLEGGAGADHLFGGAGDDMLQGGAGNDGLTGGPGIDTADYAVAAAGVTVNLLTGLAANDGNGDPDTLSEIEIVVGSAFDDSLTGDAGANTLAGGAGHDVLNGGEGDDVLRGGAGVDVLNGGLGIDTVDYSGAAAGMRAQLNSNASTNDGDGGTDTFSGIENLTGSAFNDILIGDGLANVLRGGTGADTLLGLAGNDTLWGGSGALNTLQGGLGDDTYVLEAADSIVENVGEGIDTVDARINTYVLANNVERLIFGGTGNFAGTGNALANVITGGAGADVLRGRGGVDVLNGGGGVDTADYTLAAAGVVARIDLQRATNDGDGATDTYTSIENLIGSNFNDTLIGDANANVLMGGIGTDTLLGFGGNDILMGGSGGGNNQLQGGTGDDRYILDAFDTCVEFAGEGNDTVEARVGSYTLGNNIENLIYTGPGKFVGAGNALDNVITGGALDDILRGRGGNDVIRGGTGMDEVQLTGSKAQYTVTVEGAGWRIVDAVAGRDGSTYVESIERLRFLSGNTTTVLSYAAPGALEPTDKTAGEDFGGPMVSSLMDHPEVLPGADDDFIVPAKAADLPLVLPSAFDDGLFMARPVPGENGLRALLQMDGEHNPLIVDGPHGLRLLHDRIGDHDGLPGNDPWG